MKLYKCGDVKNVNITPNGKLNILIHEMLACYHIHITHVLLTEKSVIFDAPCHFLTHSLYYDTNFARLSHVCFKVLAYSCVLIHQRLIFII